MNEVFGQTAYRVRHEWGPVGALAVHADAVVVVDVLSFSTTVTVAVERGTAVYPYRWRDDGAADFALAHNAVLAVGRSESIIASGTRRPSLSPASIMECEPVSRLVLPSPNGSTIVSELAATRARVAVGCLRNATAVAEWLIPVLDSGGSVAVVSAGERWHTDDSLRPALEDYLGAGAILSALAARTADHHLSPEASVAAAAFEATVERLVSVMAASVGGRELQSIGFGCDVEVASALDSSSVVPVLEGGAFR